MEADENAADAASAAPDGPHGVGAALERLDGIDTLPLDRRADAFHEIHENLRAALAEIDDA